MFNLSIFLFLIYSIGKVYGGWELKVKIVVKNGFLVFLSLFAVNFKKGSSYIPQELSKSLLGMNAGLLFYSSIPI